uniref:FORGETTER1 first zinc ribbon domain-containing protein n=1 Tax=Quercus lobata TaxID=97700 RepID=A0A7N2R403_QUELO
MSQPPVVPPQGSEGGGVQVRCGGCKLMILMVAPGVTDFVCPTCQVPQMLPPELMKVHSRLSPLPPQRPRLSLLRRSGCNNTCRPMASIRRRSRCLALIARPFSMSLMAWPGFTCPQCNADLTVDLSKLKQFFQPEEINEVLLLFSL